MAFKILSPNELAVLSEDERKAYETAYAEYRERAAFIDRLEQLEKVQMPRVSVKKKSIKKIKAPSVPASNMRGFTADTTQGAILLNATKKVKAVLSFNSQVPSIAQYKATLPCVGVISPNKVNIEENVPYKVTDVPAVPIATPTEVQFEGDEYKISNLYYPQQITPNTSKVKINSYTVSGLPEINTSMPDVSVSPLEPPKHIALDNVPIAKPTTIDAAITKYEVTSCDKTIVETPRVEYSAHKAEMTALSAVPVVKPQIINGVVKTTKIEAPTPLVINSPEISVEVSPHQISSLKSVVIPVAALTISIATASVNQVPSPTLAVPGVVEYADPKYHISIVAVPSVSAPVIDEKKELNAILSKIR